MCPHTSCVLIPHVSSYSCVLMPHVSSYYHHVSSCYPHTIICTGRRSSSSSIKQHYKTARAGSRMARLRSSLRERLRSRGWVPRPSHLIVESRIGVLRGERFVRLCSAVQALKRQRLRRERCRCRTALQVTVGVSARVLQLLRVLAAALTRSLSGANSVYPALSHTHTLRRVWQLQAGQKEKK
jgi:hypothetical protein